MWFAAPWLRRLFINQSWEYLYIRYRAVANDQQKRKNTQANTNGLVESELWNNTITRNRNYEISTEVETDIKRN